MRCEAKMYGNKEVTICTNDKLEWFEKVDTFEMAWSSTACIAEIVVGAPIGCMGYVKWFLKTLDDVVRGRH